MAGIDLGSNTFLCLIVDIVDGKIQKTLYDEVRVVRLGQNLFESKKFHPAALKRADECLATYSENIKKYNVEKIFAVATSAARDAENKDELFKIGLQHNIPIKIIDGKTEAQVTYIGSTVGVSESESVAVIDVGGGSTEVVCKDSGGQFIKHSFNLGCVRLTEKFISKDPISKTELDNLKCFIENSISEKSDLLKKMHPMRIIAVAGTPTTLADILLGGGFDQEKIDNYFISCELLVEWIERLSQLSNHERLSIKGMARGREDVIVSGLVILSELVKVLGLEGIFVSTKGVRYGVAIEGYRGKL
ncbi:MAG: Ppx/GppA phosphatase family protein [Pseudomonadota bacterium]|nr:Ppx/GppA phosphatase family protein [Pseudomonadota bacterium]